MDRRSLEAGLRKDDFWYKSKLDLIEILFRKVCFTYALSPTKKILNIGVGSGDDLSVIKKFGNIFAIDTDEQAIRSLPCDLYMDKKVASVTDIDYPNDFFDIVVAFDVLEYVEDHARAIREIIRVLRPGGVFLFTVPALPALYSSHDLFYGHVRRYDMKTLKDILAGWKCRAIGYWMFFLFGPIALKKLTSQKGSKVVNVTMPRFFHKILYRICRLENYLIEKDFRLPIGTTIYGIYEKR